jgi:hypothetical protein
VAYLSCDNFRVREKETGNRREGTKLAEGTDQRQSGAAGNHGKWLCPFRYLPQCNKPLLEWVAENNHFFQFLVVHGLPELAEQFSLWISADSSRNCSHLEP